MEESDQREVLVLDGATVLLLEDDPSVSRWIARLLERNGCKCEHHESVTKGLAAVAARVFDLAVLDVQLPDGRGFEVLGALRKHDQPCGVVIMTGDPAHQTVVDSIEMGVTEFLPKPFRAEELLSAMSRAHGMTTNWRERLAHATPGARGELSRAERLAADLAARGGLTDRERETLADMLAGRQYSEIAARLRISPNTVKYHALNVLRKLDLKSRNELVRLLVGPGD